MLWNPSYLWHEIRIIIHFNKCSRLLCNSFFKNSFPTGVFFHFTKVLCIYRLYILHSFFNLHRRSRRNIFDSFLNLIIDLFKFLTHLRSFREYSFNYLFLLLISIFRFTTIIRNIVLLKFNNLLWFFFLNLIFVENFINVNVIQFFFLLVCLASIFWVFQRIIQSILLGLQVEFILFDKLYFVFFINFCFVCILRFRNRFNNSVQTLLLHVFTDLKHLSLII